MAENSSDKIEKLLNSSEAFFSFKKLSVEDLELCYALETRTEKSLSKRSNQDIKDFLTKYECFGIVNSNILLGFAVFSTCGDTSELIDITVHPSYRNKKIGLNLLQGSFSYLVNSNIKEVILEVAENNLAAINLYNKFSPKLLNIRKNYYLAKDKSRINAFVYKITF
ncbi:MAG: GNAT family N-acetyltransferase [Proteobacteria bacterium]|nr:GNAT family N-acetyltransferase [Pseudomonadota bacterium]